MKLKFGILAFVNPTKRNLRKKIGLSPIILRWGEGGFCPSIYKKSTSKPCRKLKFGMLAYVNQSKRNLRKNRNYPFQTQFAPQFTKNQILNHIGS